MASEALYAGLAAGGNELASIMREKRKAELEERLMREREAAADRREEARAARAEARELKKTTRSEYNPLTGVITEYNSENTALRERPASHAEISDYTNKQRTNELNLEKLAGTLADAEWERTEGRRMDKEEHDSNIRYKNSLSYAAQTRSSAGGDYDPVSGTDVTNSLLDANEALVKELTLGKLDKDGNVVVEPLWSRRELAEFSELTQDMWKTTKGEPGNKVTNYHDFWMKNVLNATKQKEYSRKSKVNPSSNSGSSAKWDAGK